MADISQVASLDPQADAAAEQAANEAAISNARGSATATGEQEGDTTTPSGDLILGKFKDHSELEKAYQELQKKLGSQGTQPDSSPTSTDTTETSIEAPSEGQEGEGGEDPKSPADLTLDKVQQEAQEAVTNAGLDFEALTAEYNESGELSEGTYENLEKAGIPRGTVDSYIQGQLAIQAINTQQILEEAGGRDSYMEMAQWAAQNYSDAEKQAFDQALESGSVEMSKLAVAALKARYVNENGTGSPRITVDGSVGHTTSDAFSSKRQQIEAIRDPRYDKDPAYRADVERRTRLAIQQGNW